jgi:signal transduction histidine kinase
VEVQDNGVGLTADQAAAIFGMFEQVQEDSHMRSSGLGIGLALSRRLAALHGADIAVASDGRGQGSRFTLTIPAWVDLRVA